MSELDPGQPAPAPEPAPPAAPAPNTVMTPAPEGAPAPASSMFPDDWKSQYVSYALDGKTEGEDYDKLMKRADRWNNPGEVMKSFLNIEKQFKQGEDPNPFPEDGTDEQVSAWRKASGIPEDGYKVEDLGLNEETVIGEDNKDLVENYLEKAHKANIPPAAVKQNLEMYFEIQDQTVAERAAQDDSDKAATQELLTKEMGKDIAPRVGAAIALFKGFSRADGEYVNAPDGMMDQILGARLADGTALGNDANTLKYLSAIALELDPEITRTGPSHGGSMQTIDTRMGEISQLMKDKESDYYKGQKTADGNKTLLEQEYYELILAKERMNKRNSQA